MTLHVEALPFKVWRDHITHMIYTADYKHNEDNRNITSRIRDKLAYFEDKLPRLKEVTSILEIALWKMKINNYCLDENTTRSQKKVKIEESDIRSKCRITCGADVVIGHVLPFLITA
jgi:hypothetical protein